MRFVDEVNEKISQVQEQCLAIYNGFYCLNQILSCVLYCCENLNRKFYSNIQNPSKNSVYQLNSMVKSHLGSISSSQNILSTSTDDLGTLQADYSKNIIEKLEHVKQILNQISPLNFRLEILENIYSILYISSGDLKEPDEEQSEEDSSEKEITYQTDPYEVLKPSDETEFSIYELANNPDATNRSLKSTQGSCYSQSDQDNNKNRKLYLLRRNAGGGGSFLVNDFLCRDLLLILKESLQIFSKSTSKEPELSARSVKLIQLVSETLWRFQIVKPDSVQIDFGKINHICLENESVSFVNEKEQNLVYELMKKESAAVRQVRLASL